MTYTWQRANGTDVAEIVNLSERLFSHELNTVFTIDTIHGACELTLALVKQFYDPKNQLIMVARDSGQLLAWFWVERGQYAVWSSDEFAGVKMLHLDMQLPAKTRVRLVVDALNLWEVWARESDIPIICSATVRRDQQAFLRLHERMGYQIHGSVAYKRLV